MATNICSNHDTTIQQDDSFLPDEILYYVLSLLEVRDNLEVSLVSKRCRRICGDQKLWYNFCAELSGKHTPLMLDIKTPDYKKLYMSLQNKTPREVSTFLMLDWIMRRAHLTVRDPQFLNFYVHLYAGRNTSNEYKQILYLDTSTSVEGDGVYRMKFKPFPNQDFPPVFFFGERQVFTVCDFVVVSRMLEPREKRIMDNINLQARAPPRTAWHFGSRYNHAHLPLVRLRVFPLSSRQLEKIGVQATCPRNVGSDHSQRFESTENTNWRLRSSSTTVPYNVGEVVDFEVCMDVEEIFRAVNPTYFETIAAMEEEEEGEDDE